MSFFQWPAFISLHALQEHELPVTPFDGNYVTYEGITQIDDQLIKFCESVY